jgi:succinoglycan biosynthesis transport protein ExoP
MGGRSEMEWADGVETTGAPPSSLLNPQRLLSFLWTYWWVPALTLILALGATVAYVLKMPPTYVSKAFMWETVKLRLPEGSLFSEDVQNFLGTQTELLKSRTLRDLTLARLRLGTTNIIPVGPDKEPLGVDVRVAGSAKSSVFRLEASTADPSYARAYLDALMAVYLEYKRNIRKVVSGDTLASITEQVQKAEREWKTEQDALTAFQRTNNLAILEEEGRIAGGYLARLKTQLSDYQLEVKLLDSISRVGAPGAPSDAGGTVVPQAVLEAALGAAGGGQADAGAKQTAFKDLELLKMQRERLSRYLRPKHPKIVRLNTEIERAGKLLDLYRRQTLDQMAASREGLRLKIDNVETSIREWEGKVIQSNSRISDAEALRVKVQRSQSVYDRLSLLLQNVVISRNIDQETLSVLEDAGASERTYVREIKFLALAAGAGIALGLGIVFLVAFRDDRLLSTAEVIEQIGAPVLGQVPKLRGLKIGADLGLGATLHGNEPDGLYAYAESFRSLRSALFFMPSGGERPQVILVTSAQPHEGKSTISVSLADTLARAGARVILVDADLRKGNPRKQKTSPQSQGLAEALQDPSILEALLEAGSSANPVRLSRGISYAASADLLVSDALDLILLKLRKAFDYVVIDCSPLFAADDAAALAPKVDGTLLVVRRRFSGVAPVREALDQLLRRNARVLGVVLNEVDASTKSYYYYKYDGYDTSPKRRKEAVK